MMESIIACSTLAVLAPWLHRILPRGAGWILAACVAAIAAFLARHYPPIVDGQVIQVSARWFTSLGIRWSFHLDGLSLTFGLLITGIGALILIYANGYWAGHRHLGRLLGFLLAFMASMLGVVFADNLFTLFVFWELTSLTSYFLIGINHERPASRSAALQALLVTGGGGLALLAGFILLGIAGGSYELSQLAAQRSAIVSHPLYLPMLALILLGAFTKSAQFPFHFWLPNAMEAPTPVSAYLHSATMVKAGVYLLARLGPTLGDTTAWNLLLTAFGGATLVIGAAMALGQTDLKRLLAYSTVSMLGALTMLIGIGSTEAAIAATLLLVAHAAYKAALFLAAGAIDHETGTRDIRRLRGLSRFMPITAVAVVLAAASNAGLPPLLGYIAKESAYEAVAFLSGTGIALALILGIGKVLLVATSLMIAWRPLFGTPESALTLPPRRPHEAPLSLWLPPVVLSLCSLVMGVMPARLNALISAAAGPVLGETIDVKLAVWHGINLPLILSAVTIAAGATVYWWRSWLLERTAWLRALLPWGPQSAYAAGLSGLNAFASWQTRLLQNGYLRTYIKTIVLTMTGLVGLTLLRGGDSLTWVQWTPVQVHEVVPLLLIVAGTIVLIQAESRLVAVAALGTVGFSAVLLFVFFGAPDLAMTQFAVETLTVILFVLVLYRLPRFLRFTGSLTRTRDSIMAAAAGGLITLIVLAVTSEPAQTNVSAYLSENSVPLGKGRNIVNVILVDFRALDTLGEITVLAIAAIGIHSLMRLSPGEEKKR